MKNIFETNYSFLCEIAHYGKNSIFNFEGFFNSLVKNFILGERLSTMLIFYEILKFFDFS